MEYLGNVQKNRKTNLVTSALLGKIIILGAGEIREAANLINRGNIFQEIREHLLRNTRINIFFPFERSKQMGLRKKIDIEWGKVKLNLK